MRVGIIRCSGEGVVMEEALATISYQPAGDTPDGATCSWSVQCPSGTPTLTFIYFETEANYDFVSL